MARSGGIINQNRAEHRNDSNQKKELPMLRIISCPLCRKYKMNTAISGLNATSIPARSTRNPIGKKIIKSSYNIRTSVKYTRVIASEK